MQSTNIIDDVLYRTTASPRQSTNSCKHDLPLLSACAFFDILEKGIMEKKLNNPEFNYVEFDRFQITPRIRGGLELSMRISCNVFIFKLSLPTCLIVYDRI
nr:MAG TPA: hypothetical protein [Caudoviricetes sp.]